MLHRLNVTDLSTGSFPNSNEMQRVLRVLTHVYSPDFRFRKLHNYNMAVENAHIFHVFALDFIVYSL